MQWFVLGGQDLAPPNCDSDPSCWFVSAMSRHLNLSCRNLEVLEVREDLTTLQGSHGLLKIHFLSTESSQYPEKAKQINIQLWSVPKLCIIIKMSPLVLIFCLEARLLLFWLLPLNVISPGPRYFYVHWGKCKKCLSYHGLLYSEVNCSLARPRGTEINIQWHNS